MVGEGVEGEEESDPGEEGVVGEDEGEKEGGSVTGGGGEGERAGQWRTSS